MRIDQGTHCKPPGFNLWSVMPKLNLEAFGYRLQNMGGHDWIFTSPSGDRHTVDMDKPECSCLSREHPYCKHVRFLAGLYCIMVDISEPENLPVTMRRLGEA